MSCLTLRLALLTACLISSASYACSQDSAVKRIKIRNKQAPSTPSVTSPSNTFIDFTAYGTDCKTGPSITSAWQYTVTVVVSEEITLSVVMDGFAKAGVFVLNMQQFYLPYQQVEFKMNCRMNGTRHLNELKDVLLCQAGVVSVRFVQIY